MKKFLTAAAFVLAVIIGQAAQIEAREVYGYSETRGEETSDTYVLTNTIESASYGKKVTLYTVDTNFNYSKYWEVGFTRKGD